MFTIVIHLKYLQKNFKKNMYLNDDGDIVE